jgi:hypothetical protein
MPPAISATVNVKSRTERSGSRSIARSPTRPEARLKISVPADFAMNRPSTPPAADSSRLSVTS